MHTCMHARKLKCDVSCGTLPFVRAFVLVLGWLSGWLAVWLAGWLAGRVFGCMHLSLVVAWLVGWLVGWLVSERDNVMYVSSARIRQRAGNTWQVEISAPAEYMVRPPQAPVFVFVIDVSHTAVASGMLQCAVDAIKASLQDLPGSPRTQVAFITYDSTVHYYNLKQTLRAPQMIAVPEIDDVYVPLPDDLLVNLYESRELVDMLLDSLVDLFLHNNEVECAMGAAVKGAFQIMQHIGGKMLVFQTCLLYTSDAADE